MYKGFLREKASQHRHGWRAARCVCVRVNVHCPYADKVRQRVPAAGWVGVSRADLVHDDGLAARRGDGNVAALRGARVLVLPAVLQAHALVTFLALQQLRKIADRTLL